MTNSDQSFSEAFCAAETPEAAGDLIEGFREAGYWVSPDTAASATRRDAYVVFYAVRVSQREFVSVGSMTGTATWTQIARPIQILVPQGALDEVASLGRARTSGATRTWVRVFDSSTLSERAPRIELFVSDDEDAFGQLRALDEALGVEPGQLTIKPPRGWHGYGP